MPKIAFAYIDDDGEIMIETVSQSERAAMVNTIVVATHGNVIPTQNHTEDDIDRMYLNATGGTGQVVAIEITEIPFRGSSEPMIERFNQYRVEDVRSGEQFNATCIYRNVEGGQMLAEVGGSRVVRIEENGEPHPECSWGPHRVIDGIAN